MEHKIKKLIKQASLRFSSETSVWSLRHTNNATSEVPIGIPTHCCKTSEWLMFIAKWAIFHRCHVENKLMFDEMTIPGLYYTCWVWFFIVLVHYNNRPSVVPHGYPNECEWTNLCSFNLIQILRKCKMFLLHWWHPSCYSCYKPVDKS